MGRFAEDLFSKCDQFWTCPYPLASLIATTTTCSYLSSAVWVQRLLRQLYLPPPTSSIAITVTRSHLPLQSIPRTKEPLQPRLYLLPPTLSSPNLKSIKQ